MDIHPEVTNLEVTALRALQLITDTVTGATPPLSSFKMGVDLLRGIIVSANTPVQWDDIKAWINNLKSEATIVWTLLHSVQAVDRYIVIHL